MKKMIYLLTISFLILNCSKTENSNPEIINDRIILSQVSQDNCFNIEKFMQAFKSLDPATQVSKISTDLSFDESEKPFAENLKIRLSYAFFEFSKTSPTTFDHQKFLQSGCKEVTIYSNSFDQDVFKVIQSSQSMIQFINEEKETYLFEWISDQKFKTEHAFKIFDFSCDQDFKGQIKINYEYNWDKAIVENEFLPGDLINFDFLNKATEAISEAILIPTQRFYTFDIQRILPQNNQLVRSELVTFQELKKMTLIDQKFLICSED